MESQSALQDRNRMIETAAGLAPAVVPVAGTVISLAGLKAAVITPECEHMLVCTLAWGLVAAAEITRLIVAKDTVRNDTQKKRRLHCIEAAVILSLINFLIAMYGLRGSESLFLCGLRASPQLYVLCMVSAIMLMAGCTRVPRVLSAVAAAMIFAAWVCPVEAADWDGIRYCEEIVRYALLGEMMIPLYVVAILPPSHREGSSLRTRLLYRLFVLAGGRELIGDIEEEEEV